LPETLKLLTFETVYGQLLPEIFQGAKYTNLMIPHASFLKDKKGC
jgi:hypothetical protein